MACTPEPPPITYETEHFLIGLEGDHELCEGFLQELDQTARYQADYLGVDPLSKQPLYIYDEQEDLEPYCNTGAVGCYRPWDDEIHTNWGAINHEVGHASKAVLGRSSRFLEEGTATALQRRGFSFGRSSPGANLLHPVEEVEYLTGAHFVRWLSLEYGETALRRLLSDIDSSSTPYYARTSFESILGEPFEAMESRYEDEAPVFIPGNWSFEPEFELSDEDVELSVSFDCSSQETSTSVGWMMRRVDFNITEKRAWQILSSGGARIRVTKRYPYGATPFEVAYPPRPSFVHDEIHHGGDWAGGFRGTFLPGHYHIDVALSNEAGSEDISIQFLKSSVFNP